MSHRLFAVLVLLGAGFLSPLRAEEKREQLAQAAAEKWLHAIDKGEYQASWSAAAKPFQTGITTEKWAEALNQVRKPLGEVISRNLKQAEFKKALPGAPDGEYVVLQFDTSFANKKEAVETIVPMLAGDGSWKVSGYFIK
jgi:hypothetical protein